MTVWPILLQYIYIYTTSGEGTTFLLAQFNNYMNNTHILTQLTTAASRELHLLHELHQVLEAAADDLGAQIFVKDMIWKQLIHSGN